MFSGCSNFRLGFLVILEKWLVQKDKVSGSNNNDSLLLRFDGLWKVKANYVVYDDKHNLLLFCVKMFQATGDFFYLEIICPDWDIY